MKEIELTQGYVALIDNEDFDWINQHKWNTLTGYYNKKYAFNTTAGLMHRFILDTPPDMEVDHKDGNTLNNQRSNIRNCTKSQNLMNKKKYGKGKYKGVSWHPVNNKWRARITYEHTEYFLGYFDEEDDAARAYNVMAKVLCGDFAVMNDVQ